MTETETDAVTEKVFIARDDGFHFDQVSDRWWETETAWFSFHHPGRKLGGWLYTMVRPNIGTVAGGVWIWDDSAHLPWEVPYSTNFSALQLPRDQDLTDITLPTGVSIKMVEPTKTYDLGYSDGEALQLSLRFDAVMAPQPLTAVGSTFGHANHFDQIGRVTGEIVLHGERIEIDCLAVRDRTWGPRPENRPRQAAYVTGVATADHGFLAVSNGSSGQDPISYGFLRRAGRTVNLSEGQRTVRRDDATGWIAEITIDAVDSEGRSLRAIGTPASRITINRHTFIDVNSLIHWDLDGAEAWGEDQDMWPVHTWSAYRREHRH